MSDFLFWVINFMIVYNITSSAYCTYVLFAYKNNPSKNNFAMMLLAGQFFMLILVVTLGLFEKAMWGR